MLNAQYNSWRGCALSVAMPQALRQLLETLCVACFPVGVRSVQVPNAQYL